MTSLPENPPQPSVSVTQDIRRLTSQFLYFNQFSVVPSLTDASIILAKDGAFVGTITSNFHVIKDLATVLEKSLIEFQKQHGGSILSANELIEQRSSSASEAQDE